MTAVVILVTGLVSVGAAAHRPPRVTSADFHPFASPKSGKKGEHLQTVRKEEAVLRAVQGRPAGSRLQTAHLGRGCLLSPLSVGLGRSVGERHSPTGEASEMREGWAMSRHWPLPHQVMTRAPHRPHRAPWNRVALCAGLQPLLCVSQQLFSCFLGRSCSVASH